MTPILSAVVVVSILFVTFTILGLSVAVIFLSHKVTELKNLARNASERIEWYLKDVPSSRANEEHTLVKALRYCERAYEEPE